jgi:hypothetical protein
VRKRQEAATFVSCHHHLPHIPLRSGLAYKSSGTLSIQRFGSKMQHIYDNFNRRADCVRSA